ncbi:hypothetical protein MMC19_005797 [Ptychographa xylographoides]|nr:hypothetical protein [Ptychographa xylographoides]
MRASLLFSGLSSLFLLPWLPSVSSAAAAACSADNCLRALEAHPAAPFCATYTTKVVTATQGLPTWIPAECGAERISSACKCLMMTTTTTVAGKGTTTTSKPTTTTTSKSSTTTTSKSSTTTSKPTTTTTSKSSTTTTSKSSTTTSKASSTTSSTTLKTSTPTLTTSSTTSSTQTTLKTMTTTPQPTPPPTSSPAPVQTGAIYNVVANGNFVYDASAPGGLAGWLTSGDAQLVASNSYKGDGNTGNYAVQLITGSAAATKHRKIRRQSPTTPAGIEQMLTNLGTTSQYTVSLWYYVDYTAAANSAPQNCRIDAYYGNALFSSTPYFAANTGQSSAWVQFVSSVTPAASDGNLEFLLDCVNGGTAQVLIDEVFVSNQVTPNNIDNYSLTYTLAPTTSTGPITVASSSITPPNPTCSIHLALIPPNGAVCQKQVASAGSADELFIYGALGIDYVSCAQECLATSNCQSFSWGPMSGNGQCILYPQNVAAYGAPASSTSGLYVWDKGCWTYLGPSGSSCSATATTTATPTTTYTPSCSSVYPSPASTCAQLLPNPSPSANLVCGLLAAGIQDVYAGAFATENSCQLGCLQSATCRSWAFVSTGSGTACQFSDREFLLSNQNSVWAPNTANGQVWFDNECFRCAGDALLNSCPTTTTATTTTSPTAIAPSTCPSQLVLNPSFESFDPATDTPAAWTTASFSTLQSSGSTMAAVDGAEFASLNPGFVAYNYGPGTGQPTSAAITQALTCLDPALVYAVDLYWYLHEFLQTQGNTGQSCTVYVQVGAATVFNTTLAPAQQAVQAATWRYTHTVATFVPVSNTATLLVGADCGGNEGLVNVDLVTVYVAGGSSGLSPNYEYPSP